MVPTQTLEERLERGEVVYYPACPFRLPPDDDREFLRDQELGAGHKNISYTPRTGRVRGFRSHSAEQARRLSRVLDDFSRTTTQWLAHTLSRYSDTWKLDQVSFRPQEEAGRVARLKARNDLLHVDAFPSRPTHGDRILRVFANLNLTQPRVWITAAPFAQLLEQFAPVIGLPAAPSWAGRMRSATLGLFRPGVPSRSGYDDFMLRLHDFLKANAEFQRDTPRLQWVFPPGSAWLAMTDTCSHAVLGGRFALEHSYFVSLRSLALPEESPLALLERACGQQVGRKAA